MDRLDELQQLIKDSEQLTLNAQLLDYAGVVAYHPEELVITVKAGTPIKDITEALAQNNQGLSFYVEDDHQSIGSAYAQGGSDLSDAVLGVQIIDGRGDLLNFGGQVMKNVAGYDVARLLAGSQGKLALVTELSFKVMPKAYIGALEPQPRVANHSELRARLEQQLKTVFDPDNKFL